MPSIWCGPSKEANAARSPMPSRRIQFLNVFKFFAREIDIDRIVFGSCLDHQRAGRDHPCQLFIAEAVEQIGEVVLGAVYARDERASGFPRPCYWSSFLVRSLNQPETTTAFRRVSTPGGVQRVMAALGQAVDADALRGPLPGAFPGKSTARRSFATSSPISVRPVSSAFFWSRSRPLDSGSFLRLVLFGVVAHGSWGTRPRSRVRTAVRPNAR